MMNFRFGFLPLSSMILAVQPANETSEKSGDMTPALTRTRDPIASLPGLLPLMLSRAPFLREVPENADGRVGETRFRIGGEL